MRVNDTNGGKKKALEGLQRRGLVGKDTVKDHSRISEIDCPTKWLRGGTVNYSLNLGAGLNPARRPHWS